MPSKAMKFEVKSLTLTSPMCSYLTARWFLASCCLSLSLLPSSGLACQAVSSFSLAPKKAYLLVDAARASGVELIRAARAQGFYTIHVHRSDLPEEHKRSFQHEPVDLDIEYIPSLDPQADAQRLFERISPILQPPQPWEIVGVSPGTDYSWPLLGFLEPLIKGQLLSEARKDIILSWRDKISFNTRMQEAGVPVVASRLLDLRRADFGLPEDWVFPTIIKPTLGWGSIGTERIADRHELQAKVASSLLAAKKNSLTGLEIMAQQMLYPRQVYFVDTLSFTTRGETKSIVTGIWLDHRLDEEFEPSIWDFIEMLPPPSHLAIGSHEAKVTEWLLERNQRVHEAAQWTSGTVHLEFMSPEKKITSLDVIYPTDWNMRSPGLDSPSLELRATGINPYKLELWSKSNPSALENHPHIYSEFRENVGLLFVRSPRQGILSKKYYDFLDTLTKDHRKEGEAYVLKHMSKPVGSKLSRTTDGASIVGTIHIAGPNAASLFELRRLVREFEKNGCLFE